MFFVQLLHNLSLRKAGILQCNIGYRYVRGEAFVTQTVNDISDFNFDQAAVSFNTSTFHIHHILGRPMSPLPFARSLSRIFT